MSKREASTGANLGGDGRGSTVTAVERSAAKPPALPRPPSLSSHPAVAPTPMHGAAAVAIPVPSTAGDRPALTPSSRSQSSSHISSVGLHAAVITPPAQLVRLGRYQIIDRIATGGMAEVYLAVHGELAGFRTPVVLKKVLPHLASNQQFIDMFLDEARIASLLDHPNVVRIYEVGRSASEYFLAMELVQGKSLSALIRRFNEQEAGPVEPRLAALIIAQAAAGLHHAHNLTDPLGNPLGLVHRDVSPQNILISFEGSVKVIDFGIARALGRISETQTGGMKGKFGYMSPEQAKGEEVDLRTDIFALGVVLWESVTGRRLFNRENDLATMRALVYEPVAKPSSVAAVAPELESIIMRALARNPKLRFQTARDMATALERYVVSAGGASVTDLGTVLKGTFVQDHSAWQHTLRTAVNLPAVTDADLAAATPAPVAVTGNTQVGRRRWPLALLLTGLVAAAIFGVFFLGKRQVGGPPAAVAPSEPRPPTVTPTLPSGVDPTAPGVTPSDGTAPGTGLEARSDPAGKGKVKSRKRPGSTRGKNPSNPAQRTNKPDRRPNPF
jgi:serine/threonine protein kinase